jgi:hypothetical protein
MTLTTAGRPRPRCSAPYTVPNPPLAEHLAEDEISEDTILHGVAPSTAIASPRVLHHRTMLVQ